MYLFERIWFIFIFAACCMGLSSCSPIHSVGNVKDERYYTDTFSVPVPKFGFDMEIYDKKVDQMYIVGFQNDAGMLLRYEVVVLPKEMIDLFKNLDEQQIAENYRLLFYHSVFTPIAKMSPNTTIIKEELKDIDGIGKAYFAYLEIPEGATHVDLRTGKQCDSIRGYLLSFCDDTLVAISEQLFPLYEACHGKGSGKMEDAQKLILEQLIEARRGYQKVSAS